MTEKPESVAPFSERFSESNPSSAARLKPLDIESEAFKAWFGGSKIVDGDGKPLRVFHGGVAGINVFGANAEETIEWAKRNNFKLSDIEQQHLEKPVWFFTDNEQVAYGYADQYEQERQAVYPVYLKMKNPLDLRPDVVGGETALKRLRDVFGYDLTDQAEKDTYLIKRQISVHVRQVHGKMKDTLSGLGYDGLIFPDTDVYDKGQHTAYVVFTPTSIKSATENTGEFSMDNPDIRFRMKPTVEPGPVNTESEAFKKWFGQSRVVDGDGKPLRVYHGTGSVFDEFKPLSRSPDFGFHFGTVGQANHFAQKAGIGGNVMPVYLSIKNPLRMRDVFSRGLEGVDSISSELVRLGIITREDRLEILEMRPLRKAMARIREAVLAAGHDGIVYENQHEGVIPADKINELPQEYQVEINDAFAKGWVGESKKWVVRKKGDNFPCGMGPTKEIAVKNALKRLNTKDFRGTNGRKFDSYIAFHPFQIKSAFSNTGEFSPDSPDIKYRLVPPRLSDGGLPPKILGPMIDAATKGWRYRPDIVVVADQNQLPLGVRMAIPPGNIVKGVCYQGAVFLVRSNLDGYRDALDTLFHEAFGHYGLRLMGEAAKPFLRDLYAAKAPEIKEIAKKYNLDVGKSRDRLAAAEEWLAREAASRPKSVWVDRAVKTVAGWLRSIGVKLKPSDREVRAWLADMRLAVVEKGAADKNTAKRILRAREARFMTVYHGTRHVWPPEPGFPHGRPRLDKVKTGEGGNAYGHGWYSAQAEEVARAYESAGDAFRIDGMSVEDFIAAKPPVTDLFEAARYLKTDVVTASKWLAEDEAMIERRVADYIRTYGENAEFMIRSAVSRGKPLDAELAKIREMFASGRIEKSANVYKLEIPDDVIPSLLDWDKPLAEQSESVRIKLEPLLNRLLEKAEFRTLPDVVKRIKDGTATGEAIYNWAGFPPEKASEYLASLGIPGCKYADQNSRKIHMALGNNFRWNVSTPNGVFPFDTEAEAGEFAEQQRTYNFVIWDQGVLDRIALLERNGKRLDAVRAAQDRQGEEDGGPKGASPAGAARPADAKRMRNVHGKRVGGRLCPAL